MTVALFALCTVTALLITMSRVIPFRMILGYATFIDVAFSVLILAFFSGTLTGAMAATVAGLFLAIILSVCRKVFGYQKVAFVKRSAFTYNATINTTPPVWAGWSNPFAGWRLQWPIKQHEGWGYAKA